MSFFDRITNEVRLMFRRPERMQCAALCYRFKKKSLQPEMLVITSRDTGRWIIPKGWPMDGKKSHEVAAREAWEEAGVVVGKLDFLGRSYVSPGALTERLWLYLGEIDAEAARGQGGGLADENEEIEVVELPLSQLAELADHGEPLDLKTRFLIEELRRRRPELFA